MAGYSGTPLPKKLGIEPGHPVAFARAPTEFAAALGDLPGAGGRGGRPGRRAAGRGGVLREAAGRRPRGVPAPGPAVAPAGTVWIAWPKRASGVATDVTEDRVRKAGLAAGMVDVKVCAIDETWSGLKFVYRLKDRGR